MDLINKTTLANGYFPNKASDKRNENDYYPTAPIGTISLLKNHDIPKRILEPCAGRGHISSVLERYGHEVQSFDLYEYENPLTKINIGVDFLTDKRHDVDGVITNPPFKNNFPEKLIRKMVLEYEYPFVAILCRITFMESSRRYKLFKEIPVSRILVFSERINCNEKYYTNNNGIGGMICYGWFIWDKNYPTTNRIDWIRPSDYINELK